MQTEPFEGVVVQHEDGALRSVFARDGTVGVYRGAHGHEALHKTILPDGTERIFRGATGEEVLFKVVHHHAGVVDTFVHGRVRRTRPGVWRSARYQHTFY